MSIEFLISKLTEAGFDAHYGEAPDGTVCPYVVLTNVSHPNFAADNKTFTKTTSLQLRLVEAEYHDWNLIDTLEDLLDELNLPYDSTDLRLPAEHVCEMSYNLTFLGGNQNG